MAQRKHLLSVDFHYDTDTGMYEMGEVDFGISGNLENYLKEYGYKGKKDIIDTLEYLIQEVEAKFRKLSQKE